MTVVWPVRGLVALSLVTLTAVPEARAQWVEEPTPSFLIVEPLPDDERPPPSDESVRGLLELERELAGHAARAAGFDHAVRSIAQREHARRRRDRSRLWDDRIQIEERHEHEARERAIRLLERFVREHPGDPVHTPDALLRLADLMYERAVVRFEEGDLDAEPDFSGTIAVLERLVDRFPSHRRIDGALYLLGYCLDRSGRSAEAMAAYRRIVCARGEGYERCEPLASAEPVLAETWLRIGEHNFDALGAMELDLAIAAYRRAIEAEPDGRLSDLARHKLAWALYRADRYPEAIEQFAEVVERSDLERARTGRAGSELREEAMQYVAIALAYDDWDGDREADPVRPLARATDPRLVPQDRGWTPEVLLRLGQLEFEEDRYDDALATWGEALARWPLDVRAPATVMRMARALERLGRTDEASARRAMLLEYGAGSEWAEHNQREHPREVAAAEELAQAAMIDEAIRSHQAAQHDRGGAPVRGDEALARRAVTEYGHAARLYREYLARYPNSPSGYELEYNLADALYWSEQYDEAAVHYERVRDSRFDDRYRAPAARRAVESRERVLEAAIARRELALRAEIPEAGTRPDVPELLQRVAHAREVYLARVPAAEDRERVRGAYAFNNALVLEQYGYLEHARARFAALYDADCASEIGRAAWTHLRNLALARGDHEEVGRLAREVATRSCAAVATAPETPAPGQCETPACDEDIACRARCDLRDLAFRAAVDEIRAADAASGAERSRRLEQGAAALVRAVDEAPDHHQAPLALRVAAEALERAGRNDAASRLYERILDEVAPRRAPDADRQRELDRVVASAWLRRGESAARAFDGDRALASYEMLIDHERFARSDDDEVARMREDAMGRAAELLARRGEHARAAAMYRRIASSTEDAANARAARFQAAQMALRAGDWSAAARELRAFADGYRDDREARELVVLALSDLAEVNGHQHRETERARALRETVDAFRASGIGPHTQAAEAAAAARFALAEIEARDLDLAIGPGAQPTLDAWVQAVARDIERASSRARQARAAYAEVPGFGSARWSIAAMERQGAIQEQLARSVLEVHFTLPRDLERRLRWASPAVRTEVESQIEDRIRQTLAERLAPIECAAIGHYAQAARLARAASLDDPHARAASDRLQAYGDERIAECLEAERARDPSVSPYQPGEFARARSAPSPSLPEDVAPPSLAP